MSVGSKPPNAVSRCPQVCEIVCLHSAYIRHVPRCQHLPGGVETTKDVIPEYTSIVFVCQVPDRPDRTIWSEGHCGSVVRPHSRHDLILTIGRYTSYERGASIPTESATNHRNLSGCGYGHITD